MPKLEKDLRILFWKARNTYDMTACNNDDTRGNKRKFLSSGFVRSLIHRYRKTRICGHTSTRQSSGGTEIGLGMDRDAVVTVFKLE